ncbi:MAG: leucyl aminopeptidase, partial [Acidimicrobiia bacterium]|nr:leucyl aminopeptidase [Acidimicrobiia bacterium]
AEAVAEGAVLAAYRFTKYKNEAKPSKLESLVVVGRGAKVQTGADRGARIAAAVSLARDLVNEPAGAMTPTRLAEVAIEVGEREGLAVTVLDEVAIANEGLGGLQGVAQGSAQPPRLIELVYEPPGARSTIALVGKGITFDSGGLSIKTADGMETMKTDMSGAAAVLATMSVLPALAPKVKVIGILPTTENMPSGTAIKPGDVLKIRNGKTVEVLNTDAEGRLVLADGLSLAVEAGVDAIVDLATLTGACMVALGRKIAGLMGNNDAWSEQVADAAERAGEKVWPLPLPDDYRKLIDSEVADIRNTGGDRYGGALTAGLFLKEFVGDVPWAHLDIAGPARSEEDNAYTPKGASGFGVRTLIELLTRYRKPARAARS